MDEQEYQGTTPETTSKQESNTLGLKLLMLALMLFSGVMLIKLSTPEPTPIAQSEPAPQPMPVQSFAEQSYQETLWQCIYLGQKEFEQFQGVTVKQFQRDIQDGLNSEGLSPRITLLRKLNFVRGNLEQSLIEQTHFGGAAQSRSIIRPAILDSLAVLYAMKAEVDGVLIQNVELSPAEYLDCLDQLSHWGKKAEVATPEFQRMNQYRQPLPREQTAQATEEKNGWQPY